jgi:hypothetical protein
MPISAASRAGRIRRSRMEIASTSGSFEVVRVIISAFHSWLASINRSPRPGRCMHARSARRLLSRRAVHTPRHTHERRPHRPESSRGAPRHRARSGGWQSGLPRHARRRNPAGLRRIGQVASLAGQLQSAGVCELLRPAGRPEAVEGRPAKSASSLGGDLGAQSPACAICLHERGELLRDVSHRGAVHLGDSDPTAHQVTIRSRDASARWMLSRSCGGARVSHPRARLISGI